MVLSNIEKYRNRMQGKTLLNLKEKEAIKKWSGLSKAKEQHLENVLRRRGATQTNNRNPVKLLPKPKRILKKRKVKPMAQMRFIGGKNMKKDRKMGLRNVNFAD